MLKKLILSGIFSTLIFGSTIKLNDKISSFSLTDQFDKIHTISNNVSIIIVTFEDETLEMVNKFLENKHRDFLEKHNAVFIANIYFGANILTKMFTLPKIREYKYDLLLLNDENSIKFFKQKNQISVYFVENSIVKDIKYIHSINKLEEILR